MKKEALFIIIAAILVIISTTSLVIYLSQGTIDPEKKKYAEFTAEIACSIAEIESLSDLTEMVQNIKDTMEDYDYDEEEIYELRDKYKSDKEFVDVLEKELEKECPEKVDEFNLNEYFDSLNVE